MNKFNMQCVNCFSQLVDKTNKSHVRFIYYECNHCRFSHTTEIFYDVINKEINTYEFSISLLKIRYNLYGNKDRGIRLYIFNGNDILNSKDLLKSSFIRIMDDYNPEDIIKLIKKLIKLSIY